MIGWSLSIVERENRFIRLFVQYNYIGKIKIGPYYNRNKYIFMTTEKLVFNNMLIGLTYGGKYNSIDLSN